MHGAKCAIDGPLVNIWNKNALIARVMLQTQQNAEHSASMLSRFRQGGSRGWKGFSLKVWSSPDNWNVNEIALQALMHNLSRAEKVGRYGVVHAAG
jgi:hypothetical protein